MLEVCRFCLCVDEGCLISLKDLLDCAHTVQDVSLFTGIQIDEDNIAFYAICLECTDKLNMYATFRKTCLAKDSHFRELFMMMAASLQETLDENGEAIEYASIQEDEMDYDDEELQPKEQNNRNTLDGSFVNDRETTSTKGHVLHSKRKRNSVQNDQTEGTAVQEDNFYSANYISPGEILFTDNGDCGVTTDWSSYYWPPKWPELPKYRPPGKRIRSLCHICGLLVAYIPVHLEMHLPVATHACPHCPVKMKQRHQLLHHIKSVHLKVIRKTCHICNIGFVHRRTYVYHMRAHGDGGETFECLVCSKVFKRSIGLEVHVKKFHSFTKSAV